MSNTKKKKLGSLNGFYRLSQPERYEQLLATGLLNHTDIQTLKTITSSSIRELGDHFIENAIGSFPIPLGLVPDVPMDGQHYMVPMAIEETSIIAALSKTVKWVNRFGQLSTKIEGECNLGQIYFPKVREFKRFKQTLEQHRSSLIEQANKNMALGLVRRGGGVKEMVIRPLSIDHQQVQQVVVHLLVDTCDAMGANIINQICEYLKPSLEQMTGEKAHLCIVSNLPDSKLTDARCVIENIDPVLGQSIESASHFALLDPYRAATSNKGVMNGMDSVLIATGNDWRAVEAGVHAYAARSGQYRSITHWYMEHNNLVGELKAPVIAGCVGGVTKLHPIAQISLKLLGVQNANELSRIVTTVGLLQNLGALRALVSDGIVKGHMRLHIKNLLLAVNASKEEALALQPLLKARLEQSRRVSLADVKTLLDQLREPYLHD